jgi:cytochrome P450
MSTSAAPKPDYDLMNPRVQASPYATYAVMRKHAPVYHMPDTGFYVVTRYELLDEVIRNPAVFSMQVGGPEGQAGLFRTPEARQIFADRGWATSSKLSTDPPVREGYRGLVNAPFTVDRVKHSQPFIRGLISELIDGFIDRGEIEFVRDFCVPLPMKVIADRMGLPESHLDQLKIWSEAWVEPYTYAMTPEREAVVADRITEMQRYLMERLEERRHAPREDILSDLANGSFRGEGRLPDEDALGIAEQILVEGNETTTNAIASGMLLLLQNPDVMAELRETPTLIKAFIEEALRLESPTQGSFRITTCDTELAGVEIPARSLVHLRLGAANRDPEQFPNPDVLDLRRANAGSHMAFGQGEHQCLGAPLAREQMRLAFEMLLERLDRIALSQPQRRPEYVPGFTSRALKQLGIRFERKR